jgi:hypothetical protein
VFFPIADYYFPTISLFRVRDWLWLGKKSQKNHKTKNERSSIFEENSLLYLAKEFFSLSHTNSKYLWGPNIHFPEKGEPKKYSTLSFSLSLERVEREK